MIFPLAVFVVFIVMVIFWVCTVVSDSLPRDVIDRHRLAHPSYEEICSIKLRELAQQFQDLADGKDLDDDTG